jgi:hypothetical protein
LEQHSVLLFGQHEAAALPLVQEEQSFLVAQEASTSEAETRASERMRIMMRMDLNVSWVKIYLLT